MKLPSMIVLGILFTATLASLSIAMAGANHRVAAGSLVQVEYDSIQMTTVPPQAYAFGVRAKTSQGLWITTLFWDFGDGAVRDVPYCCQSEVSEVQYHIYSQPGTYNVTVYAFDNAGNFGNASVTVNWQTPVPEYPSYTLTLIASLLIVLVGAALKKTDVLSKFLCQTFQGFFEWGFQGTAS